MTPATRGMVIGAAVLVAGAAAGTGLAQTSRLDADGNVREDAYIRIPLSDADQRYAAIAGARMKDVVQLHHLAEPRPRHHHPRRVHGLRGRQHRQAS